MDYSPEWWGNPYFWSLATALCIGYALASVTRFSWQPRKRIAAALFAFSAAIIVAAVGGFVVENDMLGDIGLLYALGIGALCFGAIFRFPRVAGIPFLAIAAAGAVFFVISLETWNRYEPGSPIGHIHILARDDESIRFEIDVFSSRTIATEEGNAIGLTLEYLVSSRVWFFGGRYARLFDVATEGSDQSRRSPLVARLPGWNHTVAQSESLYPRDLYRYRITIAPNQTIEWALSIPGGA